jgi:pantetheine-phosphate adenylyltransferase
MKTAIFTGSFDPLTKGHIDLIERSSHIFERVIVAVGNNPAKKYLFSKDERTEFIAQSSKNLRNVYTMVIPDGTLSADLAYEHSAVIIKGVRINADFDYEKLMHEINHLHQAGVDTLIFPCQSNLNHISSSATKEICKLNGNTEDFVTLNVKEALERKLNNQVRIILTGSIGAGKSTIVAAMKERESNVHNIDLDAIAHDILFERKEPVYKQLRDRLNFRLHLNDIEFNRKELGRVVFDDPLAREILNDEMRQPLLTRIRAELYGKTGLIVFNGALIAEAGWLHLGNNNVILLAVNDDDQRKRLVDRGYSDDQIERRLGAQMTFAQKQCVIQDQINEDEHGHVRTINTSKYSPEAIASSIIADYYRK